MGRCAVVLLAIAACGHPAAPHLGGDGGIDSSTADASLYAISIGAPEVIANGVMPRVVSISGPPNTEVAPGTDRAYAGYFAPPNLTLDATGAATVMFTPCTDVAPGCVGAATLTLTATSDPLTIVASQAIQLVEPADVGEIAPCQTTDNIAYFHSNDALAPVQSAPGDAWIVEAMPDHLKFTVDNAVASFSLLGLLQPFAPGTYENAEPDAQATTGHPGISVRGVTSTCAYHGRFKVLDYTADPVLGTVYSTTISFEEACDQAPDAVFGCIHYETTPPPPPSPPPTPDPTKVSVQVFDLKYQGVPDTTAWAIFTDNRGTVVLDTQVDSWGMAQASLPTGGEVTVIIKDPNAAGREYLHTYRAVTNGNHFVFNAAARNTGTADYMIASFTPPAGATGLGVATACGGASWAPGTGPIYGYVTFYDQCRTPTFDALSIAYGTFTPHVYVWQQNVPHLANGNMVVPNTWSPMGTGLVMVTNIPASSPGMLATWSTMIDSFEMQMGSETATAPAPGNYTFMLDYPPGAGDGTVVRLTVGLFPSLTSESRVVVASGAPTTVTIDLSSQPVPVVSSPQPTKNSVTWTQTATGTADVRDVLWSANYSGGYAVWEVIEPNDGLASSSLPSLPRAHAADDPTADRNVAPVGAGVTYTDYDTLSTYSPFPPTGAYRAHASEARTYAF